jgi:integrase
LLWYCRTERGWRRFPVLIGGNNRIRHGYVFVDGQEKLYPDGQYALRMYVGSKTVYKPAGKNAADALVARDREMHLLTAKAAATGAGATIVEEPGRTYLRRAALQFEDDAKQRGAFEAAQVNRNVTDEFIAVAGKTYADEITREDIFTFHRTLKKRKCGPRTISNKHKRLRSFLKFAGVDVTKVVPPVPKYEETLPTVYTPEEIRCILKDADTYMRLVLELGLKCGLRDQEIMHLEWTDIHWGDRVLRVASKHHWAFVVKDSEQRDVPVPTDLLKQLKKHRKENPETRLVVGTNSDKPNGKLLRFLKRLAKKSDLNCGVCEGCKGASLECQRWTLHKLRRTYATTLLRSNLDLRTVQQFMGHSDLASTMRYLRPASSKESQARINAIKWS